MTEDASTEQARHARAALAGLLEPGSREVSELITRVGPVTALAEVLAGHLPDPLAAAVAARTARADPHELARRMLARGHQLGARLVIPEDDEWPARLNDLRLIARSTAAERVDRDTYPPICLWVRGRPRLAEVLERSVAIVGARAATSYGSHVATEMAYGMANRGWAVVSGGAFGIDAAAHRGALASGGPTVVVLACGVDRAYPAAHASLFDRVLADGLLVSEWPLGADPHRHRFLVRNRVIAALTLGTVLVEANARSGARQTLGRAALLGRGLMAVPGPVTSAMSVGCHQAIRQLGARVVTCYAEVLEEIGRVGDDLAVVPRGPDRPEDQLSTHLQRILDAVPARGGTDAGQIAATAGVPLRDALRALPQLQEEGFVLERDTGWVMVHRTPTSGPAPRTTAGPPN